MIEFVEYVDDKIRVKLPRQLRQQQFHRLFRGNLVRGKPESNMVVAIDLDTRSVDATRRLFLGKQSVSPPNELEGFRTERRGPCNFGEDGLEGFTSTEIFDKGYTLYTWDILYRVQGHDVHLGIIGGGTREEFERIGREIITSLSLVSSSQAEFPHGMADTPAGPRPMKSRNYGAMRAKDKARLAKVLESLPDNVKYLRDPILAIAEEDQDMLGSGEVNTTSLVQSIEQQAASQPSGFASAHAEELEEWSRGVATPEATWAGPLWFVQAFLMGYDMFGGEEPEGV